MPSNYSKENSTNKIATKIKVWWQNGGKESKFIKKHYIKENTKPLKTLIISYFSRNIFCITILIYLYYGNTKKFFIQQKKKDHLQSFNHSLIYPCKN